jgi:hypothetical protein
MGHPSKGKSKSKVNDPTQAKRRLVWGTRPKSLGQSGWASLVRAMETILPPGVKR